MGTETGTQIPILRHMYVPEYEYYVAMLSSNLQVGETYFLSMSFTGFLNNQLRGFYRSVYTDELGNEV